MCALPDLNSSVPPSSISVPGGKADGGQVGGQVVSPRSAAQAASHAAMSDWQRLTHELTVLGRNRVYVTAVLGYAALCFLTGGFAVYGVQFLHSKYDWAEGSAGYAFGGITVFAGIVGSGCGGFLLDRQRRLLGAQSEARSCGTYLKLWFLPCACDGFR